MMDEYETEHEALMGVVHEMYREALIPHGCHTTRDAFQAVVLELRDRRERIAALTRQRDALRVKLRALDLDGAHAKTHTVGRSADLPPVMAYDDST